MLTKTDRLFIEDVATTEVGIVGQHCGVCLLADDARVFVFGNEVILSTNQYEILYLLFSDPGRVFTRDEIIDELHKRGIWPYEGKDFRAVDSNIKRLRRQLFPKNPEAAKLFLETVYCRGYRLGNIRT